ncbi:MAG TPA: nuclear transport factor 2 family protein [Deltaproteobacteria bacterium]|nr:nuclear transport factor 2 family protein [Deltaproteobacteria bacterium]
MGRWSREELEEAFQLYQDTALAAGTSGDWRAWADQFTEDATYVEHHYGTMGGREAIYNWIQKTMSEPINRDMRYFPVEWYMIDEERGWIVAKVWNRMIDPGDGSLHQQYNITILHYAGNMKWSYEEDIYNPVHFATVVKGWIDHKAELEAAAKG